MNKDLPDLTGIPLAVSPQDPGDKINAPRVNAHHPHVLQRALLKPVLVDGVRVDIRHTGLQSKQWVLVHAVLLLIRQEFLFFRDFRDSTMGC